MLDVERGGCSGQDNCLMYIVLPPLQYDLGDVQQTTDPCAIGMGTIEFHQIKKQISWHTFMLRLSYTNSLSPHLSDNTPCVVPSNSFAPSAPVPHCRLLTFITLTARLHCCPLL